MKKRTVRLATSIFTMVLVCAVLLSFPAKPSSRILADHELRTIWGGQSMKGLCKEVGDCVDEPCSDDSGCEQHGGACPTATHEYDGHTPKECIVQIGATDCWDQEQTNQYGSDPVRVKCKSGKPCICKEDPFDEDAFNCAEDTSSSALSQKSASIFRGGNDGANQCAADELTNQQSETWEDI